jgi:DNA-binding MarR family transcriptional regulator
MDQDSQSSSKISPSVALRLQNAVRAAQTADDMFDETVVEFLGISRSDGRCLDIVDRLGRCTAGRLAAESGLTTGAVTALVDRMERAGYLRRTRDTRDRRKVWIETTERSRQFNTHIWGHLGPLLRAVFENFTIEQIEAISEYMEVAAYVNRQRAALLQEHVMGGAVGPDERMREARAFAAEAERLAECIAGQIRDGKAPRDFADPEVEEE